ncbi:MAG: ACT domain-containing protein, partial [Candidatus Omnitrophica bacterium]|nr:ACT domain-containing protein [Candidatus Omnitrophota bacterium]
IEDIVQKIIQEHFVMAMMVDIKDAKCSLEKLSRELTELGKKLNLIIQVHHENIFKMMHRI